MEKTHIQIYTERYCDCPYCNTLNSEENQLSKDFDIGKLTCVSCDKKFMVNEQ